MGNVANKGSHFLNNIRATIGDSLTSFAQGAAKTQENIVDAALTGIAGATQGIFPKVSQSLVSFAQRDLTAERYDTDRELDTLDKVGNVISHLPFVNPGIAYGINALTGMRNVQDQYEAQDSKLDDIKLPLSKITPVLQDVSAKDIIYQVGTMAPSVMAGQVFGGAGAAAKVASLGTLGIGAAGGATVEALDDGATLNKALLYGAASGAVEAGTEMIGDAFGVFGGGGLLDKVIPATTIGTRLLKGALEEGGEEMISEAVSPFLQGIYKKGASEEAFTKEHLADIANAGIMGAVTSVAMAPLGSGNITDDVKTKQVLTDRLRTLEADGKLTDTQKAKIDAQIQKANTSIETKLKKMDSVKRADTIKVLRLDGFGEDGAYAQKTYERAKYSTVGTETHDVTKMATEAGFTPSQTLTTEQEQTFGEIKKTLAKLQAKGLETDGIVVVKENETNTGKVANGAKSGKIIFVNENRLTELSDGLRTLGHEATHSLPMTAETFVLMGEVMNDESNGQAMRDVLDNYDVTQEQFDEAKRAYNDGSATEEQLRIVAETTAAFTEGMSDETFMRKLVRNNTGLAVKAYNAIRDAVELHRITAKASDSAQAKAQYREMLGYAKAFEKAMTSEQIDFLPMGDDDRDDLFYSKSATGNSVTAQLKAARERNAKLAEQAKAAKEQAVYATEELTEIKSNLASLTARAQGTANMIHKVSMQADELKAMTDKKYAALHDIPVSAAIMNNEQFKGLAKQVSKLFRGQMLDPKKVRTQIHDVAQWFNADNELFNDYMDEISMGDANRANAMREMFANNLAALGEHMNDDGTFTNDNLTLEELRAASGILSFAKRMYTTYDTIIEDGKRSSATSLAEGYVDVLEVSKSSMQGKSNLLAHYNAFFTSPMTVAQHLDGYRNGFFTHYVERFRQDEWHKNNYIMALKTEVDGYLKTHKDVARKMMKKTVNVSGHNVKIGEFLDIWYQASQENGELTVTSEHGGGFTYTDRHGVTQADRVKSTMGELRAIYDSLDNDVKAFGQKIFEAYQEGGVLKAETDIALTGFTDVVGNGKYYQITRDQDFFVSKAGDASKMSSDLQSVNNLKINKKRSQNAHKIPLQAQDMFAKFDKYVRDTAMYAAFAEDMANFRRIYNKQVDQNKSVRIMADTIWDGSSKKGSANDYWTKYLNDLQGVKVGESFALVGKVRSLYAQAQLGMNIKVIAGQFASYPTAFAYLSLADLSAGLMHNPFGKATYEQMDHYSQLAAFRNYEGSSYKSETLSDKVNAIGAAGSYLIGRMDRYTIGCIWQACVHHFDGKYGGEEVYFKAAELFDKVVSETQPTYQASDRSAFQRSNNELVKALSMFTSVPMKQISELISAADRVRSYKAQKKAGYDVSDDMMKSAGTKVVKTVVAVLAANAMYAAMCQLVKKLLSKDDPEDNNGKNGWEQLGMAFLETNMSMFPILKELYGKIANDYDVGVNALSVVNDVSDAIIDFFEALSPNASDEERAKAVKSFAVQLLMAHGIPARNTWNLVYGLLSTFDKPAAVTVDSWFTTKKSYGAALARAVENGDEKMVQTYLAIQSGNDGLPAVYSKLMMNGYTDILPRSVGMSFSFNGETYNMTNREQKQFESVYGGYAQVVSNMTRTNAFREASDEVKAKAIKAIQNTYWQLACDDITGEDSQAKLATFAKAIPMAQLAVIAEACKSYTADKDQDGKSIAGSKKTKVMQYIKTLDLTVAQKKMVMAYLGYKDADAANLVKSYINSLSMSPSEKKALIAQCGY